MPGAEVVRFSPLANKAPPDNCDACWLPGGYPELHVATLASAQKFRDGLVRSHRHVRSMASAAAIWCSVKAWRMPTATGMR